MEFKIDENLPFEVCKVFGDAGHDAISVLNQQLGGRSDADIAAICQSESRILITLDADFGNILAYPPHEFPGIIVIRTDDQSKETVLILVRRVLVTLRSESPQGRLWIVESNRIRVRGPE